jgi:type IV pilus assembly protein PilA
MLLPPKKHSQKMLCKHDRLAIQGFTLIEVLVVIVTIGILVAIAVPNYARYRQRAKIAGAVSDLKYFEKGFIAYAIEEGNFPDDSHNVLPDLPKMSVFIDPAIFDRETPLGGRYNWEGPDVYPYAGIALFQATAPQHDLALLDHMLDDGNLFQGRFRQTPNGRYTYIIAE